MNEYYFRNLLKLCLFITIFSSCKTIKEIDFCSVNTPINHELNLEGIVNIDSVRNTINHYGNITLKGYYNGNIKIDKKYKDVEKFTIKKITIDDHSQLHKTKYSSEIYNEKVLHPKTNSIKEKANTFHTVAIFEPEKRAIDLIKMFSREVYGNELLFPTEYIGKIKLELISFEENRTVNLFNAWFLFFPSLFGMPVSNSKTYLEIKASIMDNTNKLIKEYSSKGEGKAFIALYWGYGNDVSRKSAIIAFKEAIGNINKKIEEDKEIIRLKLD
jgi:hypothetical protein